ALPSGADRRLGVASGVRATHDSSMLGRASAYGNRLREALRWSEAQQAVEIDELSAVQPVELHHSILWVVIAEPPEPVGSFTQGQLAARCNLLLGLKCTQAHDAVEGCLRIAQQVPRTVLLRIAHPGR